MQPTQLMRIEQVIGISAKANPASVNFVKHKLRILIDRISERDPETLALQREWGDAEVFQHRLEESGIKMI